MNRSADLLGIGDGDVVGKVVEMSGTTGLISSATTKE
jgi:hypothetical protein